MPVRLRFIEIMDKFFDALNVHNYQHGIHSRKEFQKPYVHGSDFRLQVCTACIKEMNNLCMQVC